DLIMVIYLLGLARFVLALAGLDTGAPFGGLGGSREMFFHFITEVCLFFLLAALALQWDTVNVRILFTLHTENWGNIVVQPQFLLLGLSFFIIILFENGRIPIDNPDTHLELTMGQRAITLEFSGPDLALIEWAEMIKFGFLLTLFIHLFLPLPLITLFIEPANQIGYQLGLLLDYLIKLLILIFALAIWEVHRPKLRLRQVVRPGLIAIVLSVMAIVYIVATALFEIKGIS
ncbi:MAG: NADH-quinone oxidoreductase subunit H, partial [Anaerolineales bacterium]|nr:NADH-quinone oxidoreductase subunit H [Anaerolineales bacterium]